MPTSTRRAPATRSCYGTGLLATAVKRSDPLAIGSGGDLEATYRAGVDHDNYDPDETFTDRLTVTTGTRPVEVIWAPSETDEPIPFARLRAEPTTRYTVEALELLEEERARGQVQGHAPDETDAY